MNIPAGIGPNCLLILEAADQSGFALIAAAPLDEGIQGDECKSYALLQNNHTIFINMYYLTKL